MPSQKFFTVLKGEVKPIAIEAVSDRRNYSHEELDAGIRQAIIDASNGIHLQDLVLAGRPVSFSSKRLVEGVAELQSQYDDETVFVVGNPGFDVSCQYPEDVFPLAPFKRRRRSCDSEFTQVNRPLFWYDVESRKVVYQDFVFGKDIPVYVNFRGNLVQINPASPESTKKAIIENKSQYDNCPPEQYLEQILPRLKERMQINPADLFLLEAPQMVTMRARGFLDHDAPHEQEMARNYANMLLLTGTFGLRTDWYKDEKAEKFPLEKIVRVVGGWRGDSCFRMISVAMFGYRPPKLS